MKVDAHIVGFAGAATNAIYFTLGSLFMHIFPAKFLDLTASLYYLSSFGPLTVFFDINAGIFVCGLIQSALYAYIYFYLLAYLYNYLCKH